jgi:polar amino acid transport system substrate-binding protein
MFATMAKWISPMNNQEPSPPDFVITKHEKPVTLENIPDFKHINKELGLSVTNKNTTLYNKILRKFVKGQEDFTETFKQSWLAKETIDAIRYAHTLKGSAGNIGASTLQNTAEKLEQACLLGAEQLEIDRLLSLTTQELEYVLNELREYFINTQLNIKTHTTEIYDLELTDDSLHQLNELRQLVEDFETDALDLAEKLMTTFEGTHSASAFQQIIHQIETYEFTEAEISLIRFIEKLKQS